MTMQLNERMNRCAEILNDGRLLAKLSAGDAVAQEIKYHPACLAALYNRERAHRNAEEYKNSANGFDKKDAHPIAFSELVTYICEMKLSSKDTDPPTIFRLADLISLYKEGLEQLGFEGADVNSSRLKDQLLSHIPQLEAH